MVTVQKRITAEKNYFKQRLIDELLTNFPQHGDSTEFSQVFFLFLFPFFFLSFIHFYTDFFFFF